MRSDATTAAGVRPRTRARYWRRAASGSPEDAFARGRRRQHARSRDASAREQLLQFARLVHLHHDVRAADELALDVQLRDRRPVGVILDALADLLVLEDVDRLQVGDPAGLQHLDRAAREPAHRVLGGALHEKHDAFALDELVDALPDVTHVVLPAAGIGGPYLYGKLPPQGGRGREGPAAAGGLRRAATASRGIRTRSSSRAGSAAGGASRARYRRS